MSLRQDSHVGSQQVRLAFAGQDEGSLNMTPEEFRKQGHELIDWIADYRAQLASRPVMASTPPGAIKARIPDQPPLMAEPFDAIRADLDSLVMPGLTHWQHPRFFGYFPANASLAGVLGDLVSSGLGVLGLNWQASPALTEVEEAVCEWLRTMLGLAEDWNGVIQDTASTANLLALLCARERATGYSLARGGLQSEPKPLIVYSTSQSHSSVEKAALLAGFGRANLRIVPHDTNSALRPEALEQLIAQDRDRGFVPCAVVATSGTTASTAFDPILPIAQIAQRFGIWVHVDAAMAGSAMILPECRELWRGIDEADSVVFNPHKWLGAGFDCSVYFVRDSEHLIRVMSTSPSYLKTSADGQVKNYRDWGIALGRRFRALKLWCLIRSEGVQGLQARLRRDLTNARWLVGQVNSRPNWRVVAPVPLQTVCLIHEPPGLVGPALDEHTRAWADRVNRSGKAYLTPTQLGERWVVRVSIGAETTEQADVAAVWEAMWHAAEQPR